MKRKLAVLLACTILATVPVPVQNVAADSMAESTVKELDQVSVTPTVKPKNTTTKIPQKGWYTLKNGQKKYYRNKKALKGLHKISNRRYFFDVKTGIMKKKNVTYKKVTYYINEQGLVEGWKKGNNYYSSKGKLLRGDKREEFVAYQNARKVVAKITNKKMTKEQKLKTCFRWVMPFPHETWRLFIQGGRSWYATFANDIFERKSGNCLSKATAFAYLAKACGFENVYVCTNGPRQREASHGWVEIDGLVYDAYWAKRKGFKKCYASTYKQYFHRTFMRVKIA